MKTWLNGRLLQSPDEPAISALDHGIIVGDGVFETVNVELDQPFALPRHLDRLVRSAAGLGIGTPDIGRLLKGVGPRHAGQPLAVPIVRDVVAGGSCRGGKFGVAATGRAAATLGVLGALLGAPDLDDVGGVAVADPAVTRALATPTARFPRVATSPAAASVDRTAAAQNSGQAHPTTVGSLTICLAIAGTKVAGMM